MESMGNAIRYGRCTRRYNLNWGSTKRGPFEKEPRGAAIERYFKEPTQPVRRILPEKIEVKPIKISKFILLTTD
jgi:hypothetical protein